MNSCPPDQDDFVAELGELNPRVHPVHDGAG
jgi:hypothetical protein